jgi:L-ribulokinase
MVPAAADGTPLCELADYIDRPHAYPKLWRHHAAQPQAELITRVAAERGEPWLSRYGGTISSEWEFAKALQILQEDSRTYAAIDRWVEAADWIVWQLTGRYTRNACSAGYKGILQEGRYPSSDFLLALDPEFASFVADKLEQPIIGLGELAGRLTAEAASWTNLPAGIPVAAGNVDAHVTAAACNAITPGQLVAIMGTSTCHIVNSSGFFEVPGMCGAVLGGVVSGLWGYEAGQSGVGDIFGWWVDCCVPGSYHEEANRRGISVHELLSELAEKQVPGEHGLLALDWHSGNRSILVDHDLSGVLVGQTLATKAEDVYRALIEATAYGSRLIVEAFSRSGVPVEEFVAAGGLIRNRMLMQIYADVLGMPVSVIGSQQGPALGSAIHAAVAAGAYPDVPSAAAVMGRLDKAVYVPDPERAARYDELYSEYVQLHDYFGRGQNPVMHRLKDIRRRVKRGRDA